MCGILGRFTTAESNTNYISFAQDIKKLYRLSESRGKEASGLCCVTDECIQIVRSDLPSSELIKRDEFFDCLKTLENNTVKFIMGHSRMVTNGNPSNPNNNQPVVKGDLIAVHNGIIVNDEFLWEKNPDLERISEVDTEILLALLEKHKYKENLISALENTFSELEGSVSIALIDKNSDWLLLYSNIGSLYIAFNDDKSDYFFGSERYILEKTIRNSRSIFNNKHSREYRILHIDAGEGIVINFTNGKYKKILPNKSDSKKISCGNKNRGISIRDIICRNYNGLTINIDSERKEVEKLLDVNLNAIHKLRRCSKCLLPETFPGINYDDKGICNICRTYKGINPKGKNNFLIDIAKHKISNNRYDCISPISGGRDSCYILHYLVKELHIKPVAYTYDWGLVTDLARRNIQRMCAALGVEHVLVSADINKKRNNVKKNVQAWLKKPNLGTVPLFMAGDKQFFYYAQLLKRQMHVDNVVFGMNSLEETQFKARFIGVRPGKTDDLYYNLSSNNKFKLMLGYGNEFIKNPAYINSSLIDSFTGFLSYYILPQEYLKFFDYISWNQHVIEDTLIDTYNWETSPDSKETWRIGDGTAPFYNYIYYRLAGFTEFDTFKSNQIREKMITREQALSEIDNSNHISVEGFLWYCRTIGIDPVNTIKIINSIKPLYEK